VVLSNLVLPDSWHVPRWTTITALAASGSEIHSSRRMEMRLSNGVKDKACRIGCLPHLRYGRIATSSAAGCWGKKYHLRFSQHAGALAWRSTRICCAAYSNLFTTQTCPAEFLSLSFSLFFLLLFFFFSSFPFSLCIILVGSAKRVVGNETANLV
jgi:hypothetical protein